MILVELLKSWHGWDAGRQFECTAGAADVLVRRGIAKIVALKVASPPKPKPKRTTKP